MEILKCCFCCATVFGCKGAVLRKTAFFPPSPPGYAFSIREREIEIQVLAQNAQLETPQAVPWLGVKTALLLTDRGDRIPSVFFQHSHGSFVLLFCHGNSTDLGYMWAKAMDIATQLRCSLFLFEYTGYGPTLSKPSEKALYSDIRAAYRYLTEDLAFEWNQVVVYGQSLGSALAVDLAAEKPCGGVVLHSPIASGLRMFAKSEMKTPKYDVFRNVEKIGRVRCPIFFIHGTEDRDVPIRHSEWLFHSSIPQYPPWWVPHASHNDIDSLHREAYFSHLRDFLTSLSHLHASFPSASALLGTLTPAYNMSILGDIAAGKLRAKVEHGGESCEGERLEQEEESAKSA